MSNQDRKQFPKSGGKPQPVPSARCKAKERSPAGGTTQRNSGATGANKRP